VSTLPVVATVQNSVQWTAFCPNPRFFGISGYGLFYGPVSNPSRNRSRSKFVRPPPERPLKWRPPPFLCSNLPRPVLIPVYNCPHSRQTSTEPHTLCTKSNPKPPFLRQSIGTTQWGFYTPSESWRRSSTRLDWRDISATLGLLRVTIRHWATSFVSHFFYLLLYIYLLTKMWMFTFCQRPLPGFHPRRYQKHHRRGIHVYLRQFAQGGSYRCPQTGSE